MAAQPPPQTNTNLLAVLVLVAEVAEPPLEKDVVTVAASPAPQREPEASETGLLALVEVD